MLRDAIATETAERTPGKLAGKYPPFIHIIPPTIIIPETAFVTDIKGECKAG